MQHTRQEGPDYHGQVPQTAVSLQHDKANACSHEGNGCPCHSCKGWRELVQSYSSFSTSAHSVAGMLPAKKDLTEGAIQGYTHLTLQEDTYLMRACTHG